MRPLPHQVEFALGKLVDPEHPHADAAHALLAEIYGWFTEGLDTADLQAAKTLLEALGGTPLPEEAPIVTLVEGL